MRDPLLSFILATTILLTPALPAAAQVVRGPAAVPAGAVGAWGAAVSELSTAMQVSPELGASAPGLTPILGRLRLELQLNPQSQEALSFVASLPPAVAQPQAFDALPEEEQVKVLEAAVAAASAGLQPRAVAIITRTYEGELTKAERAELEAVAAHWFYLAPGTAAAVKSALAAERAKDARGLGGRIAAALSGEKKENPSQVAGAELVEMFSGAAVLAENAPAGGKLVPGLLAPYAARVLDEAEVRARERGVPEGLIAKSVIENHVNLFGSRAARGLFKNLRARGEWTDFVSAVSLRAAERLGEMGEEGRNILAKAAEGDNLRIAVPEWHPLFGRYASISEWLTDAHGKPDDSKERKGTRLFTAFGIPVMAARSLWPALLLTAYQFTGLLHGHFLLGAATAILLYASVLGHEISHVLAARAFGIRTRKIELNFLGGGAEVVRGFRQALPEFVIAVAGPIASALIGVAMLAAAGMLAGTLAVPVLLLAGKLNLALALLNMFPLFPMDGARTLRAALTRFLGSYRATKATAVVSAALSLLVVAKGLGAAFAGGFGGIILIVIGMFFFNLSKAMGVHPGTTTVDDKRGKKS